MPNSNEKREKPEPTPASAPASAEEQSQPAQLDEQELQRINAGNGQPAAQDAALDPDGPDFPDDDICSAYK